MVSPSLKVSSSSLSASQSYNALHRLLTLDFVFGRGGGTGNKLCDISGCESDLGRSSCVDVDRLKGAPRPGPFLSGIAPAKPPLGPPGIILTVLRNSVKLGRGGGSEPVRLCPKWDASGTELFLTCPMTGGGGGGGFLQRGGSGGCWGRRGWGLGSAVLDTEPWEAVGLLRPF